MKGNPVRMEAYALVHRIDPRVVFIERHPKDLGVPGSGGFYSWDGNKTLVVSDTLISDLHDITHFILAGDLRRYPEFGLGEDPNWRSDARRETSLENADLYEERTCFLQLGISIALGFHKNEVESTGSSLNTPIPSVEIIEEIRTFSPDALSEPMWDRVVSAVREIR